MIKPFSKGRLIWSILPFINRVVSVLGISWNKYYGLLLDRLERDNDIETILQRGKLLSGQRGHKGLYDVDQGKNQLKLLRKYGLTKKSTILELGLGYGRSAIPLTNFLEKSKYTGTEISKRRLKMCGDWLERENLNKKCPELVLVSNNYLSEFTGRNFDIIWAQGVITHMPRDQLVILLKSVKALMCQKSRFIFNFGVCLSERYLNNNVKDFYYGVDYMRQLCEEHGYECDEIKDWHQYLHAGIDKSRNMAFSLRLRA